MRVCASTRTPAFRNSASPASSLRSNSVSAILSSSAIVASSSRDLDHLDEDHTLAVLVNGPGIYTRPGTLPATLGRGPWCPRIVLLDPRSDCPENNVCPQAL